MIKTIVLLLLITGLSFQSFAQARYTISGTIRADSSGENITRATIMVAGTTTGTTSNEQGFYSFTLPPGSYTLAITTVGMQTQLIPIRLTKNKQLDVLMKQDITQLKEVVVSSGDKDRKLAGTQMGMDRLSMAKIREIPVFLGETDVLKSIQLLPGIASAGDGNTGFYVRGGAPDQNQVLLDGATVYNPSHLLGFFSTFNADAIKDVTLYKGSAPPQYGGRLSSVEDISMNEGNNQNYHGDAGIGLLTLHAELEGPVKKDESSFLVAARTTRINSFLKATQDSTIDKDRVGFYDLNARLNFKLGSKDHLYVSGYTGQDNIVLYNEAGLKWSNTIGTIKWNHVFGAGLFVNTSVAISNYDYWLTWYTNGSNATVKSILNDYAFRQEWDWHASPSHTIRFGINSIYHVIQPAHLAAQPGSGLNDTTYETRYGWENALFAGDDWKATSQLTISYGLRLTNFGVYGPGNFYPLDAEGKVTDTLYSHPGQSMVNYFNPEPRLALGYQLNSRSTIKASYSRNVQNMHLLSNSPASQPTDRWDLSNNNILPEIADQFALGYYRETANHLFSWNIEAYYKLLQHQIDYRTGANIELTDIVESQLLFGKGRAYGIEGQLKKNKGKLTGWISYTLSKSQLRIDGINDNQWYNASQDRTHNIAIVAIYNPNNKWSWSADWVYYTGNAVSYPSGKYEAGGRIAYYYATRNNYRIPAYHRLDLSATRHYTKTKLFGHDFKKSYNSDLSFGLYNAYNRLNAYLINFRQDPDNANETQAVKTALFGIVPYITYTIKF